MKRTCKTCEHRDRFGQCWKAKAPIETDCRDDVPACEHWELCSDNLVEAMNASVDKAREKHPVLLDVWPEPEDAEDYEAYAKAWKMAIARKGYDQLMAILFSEVNEFLAEVARGDFDRALEEAGDIMAVLYRTLNGDGKRKEASK